MSPLCGQLQGCPERFPDEAPRLAGQRVTFRERLGVWQKGKPELLAVRFKLSTESGYVQLVTSCRNTKGTTHLVPGIRSDGSFGR